MIKYEHLRRKAIELRTKKKMALGDICKRLALSKTTVYYWIKDIKIPRTITQTKATKAMYAANKLRYKKLRDAAYNEGKYTAQKLFKSKQFRDFIVVYLCEGYRKSRNTVSVSNSNNKILRLSHKFIKRFSNRLLFYGVQLHVDQDETAIKEYWSKEFNVKKIRYCNHEKIK